MSTFFLEEVGEERGRGRRQGESGRRRDGREERRWRRGEERRWERGERDGRRGREKRGEEMGGEERERRGGGEERERERERRGGGEGREVIKNSLWFNNCYIFTQKVKRLSISKSALHLHVDAKVTSLSNPKELSVSLGPIIHKLEEVQSNLNNSGLTKLIIKLITHSSFPEVSYVLVCVDLSLFSLACSITCSQHTVELWEYYSGNSFSGHLGTN